MALIHIHVSPLTARWLHKIYGPAQPYKIRRSDICYHYLQIDPLRRDENAWIRYHKELTEQVEINISQNLKRRLLSKSRQVTVGYSLHKAIQSHIIQFIEAQTLAGIPAQTALKSYLDLYNICEDDLALDTAYTAWKRHKEKKSVKKPVYRAYYSRQIDPRKWLQKCTNVNKIPLRKDWVIREVANYYKCDQHTLLSLEVDYGDMFSIPERGRARKYQIPRQMLCYILHEECGLTQSQISSIINRNQSNVNRSIIRFKRMIANENSFAAADLKIILDRVSQRRANKFAA